MAFAAWNGSVCVTITVGISPMYLVSGATRAAIKTASSRPQTRLVSAGDWSPSESSMVTKSSSPCSASAMRSVQ